MRYYAVPCNAIPTIDQSSNPYRQGIFASTKVMRIDMPQIINAFKESKSILLFDNESDAIAYIENKAEFDFINGYRQFLSPPLLQVECEVQPKAVNNEISIKPSEATLVSGKMLFVGNRKISNLPYRSVNDKHIYNSADTLLSSEFDLRMVPIVFFIGSTIGWIADSYTINHEKTAAAVITGFIALVLYSKWCNSQVKHREEKDTDNEIRRLSFQR